MVTIHNLEVRMDVEGGGDEAAFVKLFNKYIRLWSEEAAKPTSSGMIGASYI